jgi:hypothetical protein
MALYDEQAGPARLPRRRKLPGTRLDGPEWTDCVRDVRRIVQRAARISWRPDANPDDVGISIIDHLDELDPGSLHVLAVVNAILVKASRRFEH